jgi:hypothetical protein
MSAPFLNGEMPHDSLIKTFPPVTIGKHEWLVAVHASRFGSCVKDGPNEPSRCTEYYWRRAARESYEGDEYKGAGQWPKYNHNDGCYAGLPRSLVTYYEKHETEIKALLAFEEAPQQPQFEMVL